MCNDYIFYVVRLGIAASLLVSLLAGSPAWSEKPTLEFSSLQETDLSLKVVEVTTGALRPVKPPVFDREAHLLSDLGSFKLYYDYDEDRLVPDERPPSYLHVYLEGPGNGSEEGLWYKKFRLILSAEGAFVDRKIQIPVTVRSGEKSSTGKIQVIAHHTDPVGALDFVSSREILELDVATGELEVNELALVNRSCCGVILQDAEEPAVEPTHPRFWGENGLEVELPGSISPDQEEYKQVRIRTNPESFAAFWRSVRPYSSEEPHTDFRLTLPFQVEGGHQTTISRRIAVRFRPALPWVFFSVAAGAAISSCLSLWVAGVAKGRQAVYGNIEGTAQRVREFLKRLSVGIAVSLVVFIAYLMLKGDRKVILFDYPLDPTQILPAFLIGIVVGSRPGFYYQKFFSDGGASGSKEPKSHAAGIVLLAILLGSVPFSTSEAQRQAFRPVSLAQNTATGAVYVLSSSTNTIYGLKRNGELSSEFQLKRDLTVTDFCHVEWQDSSWLATVAAGSRSPTVWRNRIMLLPLEPSESSKRTFESSRMGFSWVHGLACDESGQRLLFVALKQQDVYQLRLADIEEKAPELLITHNSLHQPSAVVVRNNQVIIADLGRESVLAIDLATGSVDVLIDDVSEPAGLDLTPDRSKLLVADAGGSRILEYDFATKQSRERIFSPAFREPADVLLDPRGHLWVADRWAGTVFEFPADGGSPISHRP